MKKSVANLIIFAVVTLAAVAWALALELTTGAALVVASVVIVSALIAIIAVFALIIRKRGFREPDPDSRLDRFDHWLEVGNAEPPDVYCPRCGRRRMRVTTFSYSPPMTTEQSSFCTPPSCEWYGEPSVPAPPR